jgi:hypothetical protein
MKKKILLLIGIFCVLLSNAQTSIEKEALKISKLVVRNVTTDGRKPSRLHEYYIYDINLDSSGKISSVDLLKLDSSFYTNDIKKIIPLIKKSWTPVKSSIVKVMIPVLIINNDQANEEPEHNMSVAEIATFFENLFKGQNSSKVFVSRMSIIESISSANRK